MIITDLPKGQMFFKGTLEATNDKTAGNLTKLDMVGYTGGRMRPSEYPIDVVIDIQGITLRKSTITILKEHDREKEIGHTLSVDIIPYGESKNGKKGPLVCAKGLASAANEHSEQIDKSVINQFPWEVSVGGDVIEKQFIPDGETLNANGQSFDGPILYVTKFELNELSICSFGADKNTSTKLAATKGINMEFDAFVTEQGFDPKTLTAKAKATLTKLWEESKQPATKEPLEAGKDTGDSLNDFKKSTRLEAANEVRRARSLNAIGTKFKDLIDIKVGEETFQDTAELTAHAIEEGWSTEKLELTCHRAGMTSKNKAPAVHIIPNVQQLGTEAISCAVVQQLGMTSSSLNASTGKKYGYEHYYSEKVLETSQHKDLQNISLHQILNYAVIEATGIPYTRNTKSDDFIQCVRSSMHKIRASSGMTTVGVSNIFDSVANKLLLAGYDSVLSVWKEICHVESVSDFKTSNLYRLTQTGGYKKVGPDGELKHGNLEDDKYTHSADTYGIILGLTRKHMINDDMGALNKILAGFGSLSQESLEEMVFVALLTDLATNYTSGNGNYIEGATTTVSLAGYDLAHNSFMNLVGANNKSIGIVPDRILTGTNTHITASKLYRDTSYSDYTTSAPVFTSNQHTGRFRPIQSPYINNTAIKQNVPAIAGTDIPNQTQTGWFLFCNPDSPKGSSLVVSALNGNYRPKLEQADANFDVLGMQWRGYHDVGVDFTDPKLSLYSKGAA